MMVRHRAQNRGERRVQRPRAEIHDDPDGAPDAAPLVQPGKQHEAHRDAPDHQADAEHLCAHAAGELLAAAQRRPHRPTFDDERRHRRERLRQIEEPGHQEKKAPHCRSPEDSRPEDEDLRRATQGLDELEEIGRKIPAPVGHCLDHGGFHQQRDEEPRDDQDGGYDACGQWRQQEHEEERRVQQQRDPCVPRKVGEPGARAFRQHFESAEVIGFGPVERRAMSARKGRRDGSSVHGPLVFGFVIIVADAVAPAKKGSAGGVGQSRPRSAGMGGSSTWPFWQQGGACVISVACPQERRTPSISFSDEARTTGSLRTHRTASSPVFLSVRTTSARPRSVGNGGITPASLRVTVPPARSGIAPMRGAVAPTILAPPMLTSIKRARNECAPCRTSTSRSQIIRWCCRVASAVVPRSSRFASFASGNSIHAPVWLPSATSTRPRTDPRSVLTCSLFASENSITTRSAPTSRGAASRKKKSVRPSTTCRWFCRCERSAKRTLSRVAAWLSTPAGYGRGSGRPDSAPGASAYMR